MSEWLSTSFDRIQVVCWLLGGGLLILAAGLKVPRVYVRAVTKVRELHGELCECLFCDQLSELRSRLEQVEQELDDLRAQGTMSKLGRVSAGARIQTPTSMPAGVEDARNTGPATRSAVARPRTSRAQRSGGHPPLVADVRRKVQALVRLITRRCVVSIDR